MDVIAQLAKFHASLVNKCKFHPLAVCFGVFWTKLLLSSNKRICGAFFQKMLYFTLIFLKVLGITAKFGSLTDEFDAFNSFTALSTFPIYSHICLIGYAIIRRKVG